MAQYLGKVVYLLRGRLRLIEFPADHPSVAPQWVHKIEHDGYRLAEALQGRLALPAEVVARSESSYMRGLHCRTQRPQANDLSRPTNLRPLSLGQPPDD